ncbi:MAG: hypothetical protein Q9213_005901 [Squamulea squamosa]
MKKESSVKNEHPVKKGSTIKKEPTAKKPSTIQEEPKLKKEYTYSRGPKLGLINGEYEITCQDLEQWENFGDDMSLILCLDSPEVWGAYDFGMFSGIIHMQGQRRPGPGTDPRSAASMQEEWDGYNESYGYAQLDAKDAASPKDISTQK